MTRFSLALSFLLLASSCASLPRERSPSSDETISWQQSGGIESATVDGNLIIVRADTKLNPVVLLNPPLTSSLNVSRLAAQQGLNVVINAAMFAKDYVTSVGYMRNFALINNSRISSKMSGFLMFNPKSSSLAPVRIGGKEKIADYHTVFQSYRMWSAKDGILWKKGASIFHQVGLVGVDAQKRILFFFHPGLIDVHDLVEKILGLNLGLEGLLYLDGGNHATLFLAPEIRSELGSEWNTWLKLPNLLGIKAVQ